MTQFIRVDRPDLKEVEIRINWINPAVIAMLVWTQRGNAMFATIHWAKGGETKIKGEAAVLLIKRWEEYLAST